MKYAIYVLAALAFVALLSTRGCMGWQELPTRNRGDAGAVVDSGQQDGHTGCPVGDDDAP